MREIIYEMHCGMYHAIHHAIHHAVHHATHHAMHYICMCMLHVHVHVHVHVHARASAMPRGFMEVSSPRRCAAHMSATVPWEASYSLIMAPSESRLPMRLEVMKPGLRCTCSGPAVRLGLRLGLGLGVRLLVRVRARVPEVRARPKIQRCGAPARPRR